MAVLGLEVCTFVYQPW